MMPPREDYKEHTKPAEPAELPEPVPAEKKPTLDPKKIDEMPVPPLTNPEDTKGG